MATNRKKATLLVNVTKDEAETAFAAFAAADAQSQKINADMDIKITKIREASAGKLAELADTKEANFNIIQNYAVNNRDDFGNKKSMEFTHGVIGFRTGTPAVKHAKGFTWESVIKLLERFNPDFLSTKVAIAKDKILADRNMPECRTMMEQCGIVIDQTETFFIEPKKEEAFADAY